MGQLHDTWKAAKAQVKKSDITKKFTDKFGAALDDMEKKRAEIKRRLNAIPKDRPITQAAGIVINKESDDAGRPAAIILDDYLALTREKANKYKDEMTKAKDKAKQEAQVKHRETGILLSALRDIKLRATSMAQEIRILVGLKKGSLKQREDGAIHS